LEPNIARVSTSQTLDAFRSTLILNSSLVLGSVVWPLASTSFSPWEREPQYLHNLFLNAKEAQNRLDNLVGPLINTTGTYRLEMNVIETHATIFVDFDYNGITRNREIGDVLIVCKYYDLGQLKYQKSMLLQAKAESKGSRLKWHIEPVQLHLLTFWPHIHRFTSKFKRPPPIPAPSNFHVNPRERWFSPYLLIKRNHSLDFDDWWSDRVVCPDIVYATSTRLGKRYFTGHAEMPFSTAIWELLLQAQGESLVEDGIVTNQDAKSFIDFISQWAGAPDPPEDERPFIVIQIRVTRKEKSETREQIRVI
jgi:hypothetical protein